MKPKKTTARSRKLGGKSKAKWDELPVPIIQNIQSILYRGDAVKASLLSKAWHNAWSTIPTLMFFQNCPRPCFFKSNSQKLIPDNDEIPSEFEKLVGETLERYARNNLLIESFDLTMAISSQRQASVIKQWLQVMLGGKNRLKKLYVLFWLPVQFQEPMSVFPPCHMIECRSLLVLELRNVQIDDEHAIHKLLSACLLIEEISLEDCTGFHKLVVKNLHRLRLFTFHLQKNQSVQLQNVPSLQSLALENESYQPLELPASLIVGSENLRSLKLGGFKMDTKGLRQFVAKFPFLELLYISLGCSVKRINITNDSLRELSLYSSHQEQLTGVTVHSPVLRRLSYDGCGLPTFFLPNIKHNQLHVSIDFDSDSDDSDSVLDNSCFLRLREIVKISYKLSINMSSSDTRFDIDLDDLKEATVPSDNVEELSIHCSSEVLEHFPAIVDALFSVCHPKYIRASRSGSGKKTWDKDFCKFLLKELMERGDSSCCTSVDQIKCWRHCLEDVQVGTRRKTSKNAECDIEGELVKLTFPWRSLFDGSKTFRYCLYFKLKW